MTDLEKSRKQRLRACEKVLAEHMEEFVKVGLALKEIRDDRLYKEDGFERFEDYCKEKWEYTKRYVNMIISSTDLRLKLPAPKGTTGSQSEWTERSVRELGRLKVKTDDGEEVVSHSKAKAVAAKVVKAVEETGGKLTSTLVRKFVDQELGIDHKPKPKPKTEQLPPFNEVILQWTGRILGLADAIDEVSDEDLKLFGREEPRLAKDLASAIERLKKSLACVWDSLP